MKRQLLTRVREEQAKAQKLERAVLVRQAKACEKMLSITNYQRNANQNQNEVSAHTGKNGYHQKITNNKYWTGCGEKGTFLYLLVGMQTSAATMENSVEIP